MLFKAYWNWIDGADKPRARGKMNAVWAPRLGLRKRREIEKALLLQTGGLELRGTAMLLSLSAARALINAKACDVCEDLSKNRSAPS